MRNRVLEEAKVKGNNVVTEALPQRMQRETLYHKHCQLVYIEVLCRWQWEEGGVLVCCRFITEVKCDLKKVGGILKTNSSISGHMACPMGHNYKLIANEFKLGEQIQAC